MLYQKKKKKSSMTKLNVNTLWNSTILLKEQNITAHTYINFHREKENTYDIPIWHHYSIKDSCSTYKSNVSP